MRWRAFRAFLAVIPAMVGCANVAGLSDLELVDSDCVGPSCGSAGAGAQGGGGGAGAGGAAGGGGASGKGGSSGAGAAGASGKGGSAGASGASGMAGAAGKAGASGAAGMGGASGMAGAAGKAGASGMGGTAGKAGSAGTGGAGGTAGKGGSGGSGGNQGGTGGTGGSTGGTGGTSGGGQGGTSGSGGMAGSGGSGGSACVPATCADLGRNCGVLPDDGCGNQLMCGDCSGNLTCGDGGYANICGCPAGKYFCNGDDLFRCADSGATTYLVAHCAGGTCDPNAGKCGSCIDGEAVCTVSGGQQTLNSCVTVGGNTTLTPKSVCLVGQICDPKGSGQCDKCVEGALSCLGTNLRKCSADGQAFATIATCDTNDLCKKTAQLGLSTCLKPLCQPNQMRCSGAQPQVCNALQDGWDNMNSPCATAELCNAGVCSDPVCDVGETKCTGNVLETCNAGRTGFDSTPCAQPDPICDIGGCVHRGPTLTKVDDGAGSTYFVDSTEVTNDQYNVFLDAAVEPQSTSKSPAYCAWNTTYGAKNTTDPGNQPVSKVDWCDAYAYCAWAGKRLCGKIGGGAAAPADVTNKSIDQWYLACVGTTETVYPYGNAYVSTACNGQEKGVGAVLAVGTQPDCDSSFGNILDLSGNVAEWEDSCTGTSGANDTCRVRGGSYTSGADKMTCGFIATVLRSVSTAKNIGFRCCAD